ncbi:MAG TPA: putative baseplate assembly protein [Kofleriaceae bacterium]|nr:putative baseplate assembly protein [Kofleriaceae bacterium]
MIPSPKLDDREFDDLVAEALRLIPRYAPEWTHHNPADPGITLIELAAWMTDLILYRLNKVPEKNYIAFLNLLGIKLKPPQAARGLLQFALVEGASRQVVPAGIQVSTPQGSDEDTITFETARDLVVTATPLDRSFSYFTGRYSDNSMHLAAARADGAPEPPAPLVVPGAPLGFEVFGGAERVDRFLYLSDPRFAGCGESSVLRIYLGCPERGGRDLARLLEWQYWGGDRWRDLIPAPLEVDRGEICFLGPLGFEPTTVAEIEGLWVRGRLAEVTRPEDTEIDTIRARVEVSGEGVGPDRALVNLDNDAFIYLDLGKNIYPLGKEPKVDCVFYLACDDLLRTPDAEIALDVTIADPGVVRPANPSEDLALSWEYFDGRRWRALGRSGPMGIRPGGSDAAAFHDTTNAFTQTGIVTFRRPKDMEAVEVAGETARWIRVRLESGDYGQAGNYTLDNDRWVFRDDRPLRPPALRAIALRAREEYRDVRHAIAYNDFTFTDVTEAARTEYTIFQPFSPEVDESPAFYLGWAGKLPNEGHSVYFHMAEDIGPGSMPHDGTEVGTPELSRYHAERLAAWHGEQRVVWEYSTARGWEPLAVADGARAFNTSGFVDFVAPDDWAQSRRFTEERFWLRARLEMGGFAKAPRILRVLTNVVAANHHTTVRGEILGSSDGTPLQSYALLQTPLLEGETIAVRERQIPPPDELRELGEEAVEPPADGDGECWVMWQRVESFFESGPRSRHYLIDYQNGRVTFGDGRRGMIPPEGLNNVVARMYRVGGGSAGNVNPNTLTSLSRALAYIDTVTNPISAAGGADRETVNEAKERAPYTIKSRDRAVTAEDFEMLTLRASTSLARARCVPDRGGRGGVTVVVVPKAETETEDLSRRLVPSNEILRYVKRYLDERRLVGTLLNVTKPTYVELSLKVALLRRTIGVSDRMRREIEERLRRHLHPLVGGRDGEGWPFGRAVLKTELIHLVEEVPGVEGVDSVDMLDEQKGVHVEQIRLDPDELPHLIHVHIVEKVRDEIM